MSKNISSIAKISRPTLSGILTRKRLFKLLDVGRKKSVIWISGPAGCGKTTLAASYLDQRKLPCIWYSIDSGDSDVAGFFYHMGLAARKAAPRSRKSLPLLTPEYLPGLQVFTRRYFEELCDKLPTPFVMVFDNYQDVPAKSPFTEMLASGIATVPQGIAVIVISRTEPPAAYARLRAERRMHVLAWDEIRFTAEEAEELVLLKVGSALEPSRIADLARKADGWAAGLLLLAESRSVPGATGTAVGAAASPDVFDYFAGEVLAALDPATREFLIRTSSLPKMTPAHAQQLTGSADAERILSSLNRSHFFTEKHLTDAGHVYCYHPLFRDFLLLRMRESLGAEESLAVRRQAAGILEAAGEIEDAALLYREAGAWDNLWRLILAHARPLVAAGRGRTLFDWLSSIPQEILDRSPWLLFWMGVCILPAGPREGRSFFKRAFLLFEAARDDAGTLLSWSSIAQTYIFEFHEYQPLDKWIDWLDTRIERGAPFPSQEIEASVAAGMAGMLLWRNPSHSGMAEWVRRAVNLARKNQNLDTWLRAYSNSAIYYIWMGEFAECSILIDEMRQVINTEGASSPLRFIVLKAVEAMLYNSTANTHEKAVQAVAEGFAKARETGVHLLTSNLAVHGASAALNEGNVDKLREFLEPMQTALGRENHAHSSHYYYYSAWHHLLRGNKAHAVAGARKSVELILKSGTPIFEALLRMLLAHMLHEAGSLEEARAQLPGIRDAVARTTSPYFEFIALLTEAYIAYDDAAGRREIVARAMQLGREKAFCTMIYFWRPAALSRICAEAIDAGIEVEYAASLVRKLGLRPVFPLDNPESWPWPLKIYALGPFRIEKEGQPVIFSGKVQQKPLEMLKALIAFGGVEVSDDRIMEALWPEAEGDVAFQSYESTLHRLRKLLGIEKAVIRSEGRLTLDPSLCWVDASAFERLLSEAESRRPADRNGAPENAINAAAFRPLETAFSLYQGNFLGNEKERPWLLSRREQLRSRFMRAVFAAGGMLEQAGAREAAIDRYRKALEIDDLSEELYQRLMICYIQEGRRADAVKVFKQCRKIFTLSLGVEPSSRTTALYTEILQRG